MKKFLPKTTLLAMLSTSALVIGCGDSSGWADAVGAAPPVVSGTEIPVSATTSAAGAFSFANQVASSPQDDAEPLVDGDAVLATSETDEPDMSV